MIYLLTKVGFMYDKKTNFFVEVVCRTFEDYFQMNLAKGSGLKSMN